MLLKAPPGVTAIAVGGVELAVTDGLVEVADSAAASLLAHGFVIVSGQEGAQESAAPSPASPPAPPPSAMPNPPNMSRREMLAWLKAKGVPVKRPIANAGLRALMRDTLAQKG